MNIPKWWPAHGFIVVGRGAHSGRCSEVAGDLSHRLEKKLWASLGLPGAGCHPAVPGQIRNGTEVTGFA